MSWNSDYGFIDRLLHRVAFATWPIQAAMADMEETTFKARLTNISLDRPVFVSGLPRAGTTMVLQLIEKSGEFASYRYRDMPFLLTPMLWRELTKSARRSVETRERAHGDGVAIGIDSPEAFEEVVWRTFCPKQYGAASIKPWRGAVDPDFKRFFGMQMRKIVAIRAEDDPTARRYLSKSNGNIARFASIARMFPDAVILAPYRNPLDHAGSLLRQHLNFLEMHAADPFAREYMAGIGHYDFGMNLKPINFGGWLDEAAPDFTTLDGWIRYWCAAYGFLVEQTDAPIHFLSYDALCEGDGAELAHLEAILGLSQPGALRSQAPDIWPSRAAVQPNDIDADLLRRADAIFERLEARRIGDRPATKPRRPGRRLEAQGPG